MGNALSYTRLTEALSCVLSTRIGLPLSVRLLQTAANPATGPVLYFRPGSSRLGWLPFLPRIPVLLPLLLNWSSAPLRVRRFWGLFPRGDICHRVAPILGLDPFFGVRRPAGACRGKTWEGCNVG